MRPDYLIEANSCEVLPMLRELFSRRPETFFFEAWELQSLLFLLGYCDGLVPEEEIVAAMEVARGDYDPEGAAAGAQRSADALPLPSFVVAWL